MRKPLFAFEFDWNGKLSIALAHVNIYIALELGSILKASASRLEINKVVEMDFGTNIVKGLRRLFTFLLLFAMSFFWACQQESIEEDLAKEALMPIAALVPADILCGPFETTGLISSRGSEFVDHCSSGPCATTIPWGEFSYFKGVDANWTNPRIEGEFLLAGGWFASSSDFCVERPGGMQFSNNVPVVNSNCQSSVYGSAVNRANVVFPLQTSWIPYDCFEISLHVRVHRLNLFSQPLQGSERDLFATISPPSASQLYVNQCFEQCIAPTTTQTQGECKNCHARISVTFNNCNTVDVTSCKQINNVVIFYDDCSWERITNPSGTLPSAAGNGKTISHVYVKSGCNISHQGPGFGARFNGPCQNFGCDNTH